MFLLEAECGWEKEGVDLKVGRIAPVGNILEFACGCLSRRCMFRSWVCDLEQEGSACLARCGSNTTGRHDLPTG